jgi:hypothetical protein
MLYPQNNLFLPNSHLWLPGMGFSRRRCCCLESSSSASSASSEQSALSSLSSESDISSQSDVSDISSLSSNFCPPCGDMPYLIVVISGITNGTCSDCASLNDAYALENIGGCWWYLSLAGRSFCGETLSEDSSSYILLLIDNYDGAAHIGVLLQANPHNETCFESGVSYQFVPDPPEIACEDVDGLSIPIYSVVGECCQYGNWPDGSATIYFPV